VFVSVYAVAVGADIHRRLVQRNHSDYYWYIYS